MEAVYKFTVMVNFLRATGLAQTKKDVRDQRKKRRGRDDVYDFSRGAELAMASGCLTTQQMICSNLVI